MADKKQSKKKKTVPLGKPLALSPADLDRLSVVTTADIEASKAAWRRNTPRKFKNLLDAKTLPEQKNADNQ